MNKQEIINWNDHVGEKVRVTTNKKSYVATITKLESGGLKLLDYMQGGHAYSIESYLKRHNRTVEFL